MIKSNLTDKLPLIGIADCEVQMMQAALSESTILLNRLLRKLPCFPLLAILLNGPQLIGGRGGREGIMSLRP